ncbi:Hypothetical protein KK9_0601 [Borreliella garinii BgVir]|uniref:Uncharacterized protein n=1 Tax=Borrelia garinii subsp. bavariensis (strain ATCC BAA-2496 / DSM 23469 / PBi) TaxID=290434 RepID=A0A7I6GWJ2_BORGP|nr:hypothetical protein BG0589 [Borreliella bavariensis PBi]AEW68911.1 Hypothetical protein KK9_0601 [Borreliella garinii BgVir]
MLESLYEKIFVFKEKERKSF